MSENNAPMKMKLMHLIIETNRQCNLNCTHCMRGDAQDLTITPEIIDKLLDQIDFIVELDLISRHWHFNRPIPPSQPHLPS